MKSKKDKKFRISRQANLILIITQEITLINYEEIIKEEE